MFTVSKKCFIGGKPSEIENRDDDLRQARFTLRRFVS